jgi:hypothetical protein
VEERREVPPIGPPILSAEFREDQPYHITNRHRVGTAQVCFGSIAAEQFSATIDLCPLFPKSGQTRVRSDRPLSANCRHRTLGLNAQFLYRELYNKNPAQKPVVQRTSDNLNYGIFSSARHQGAVSYSLHWSGVAYTRAELVRWLGLTAGQTK